MKTAKYYFIALTLGLVLAPSQPASAQMANFYTSPNYNNFVNNLISNSIWNSSMSRYTGGAGARGSSGSSSRSSSQSSGPEQVPEYRKYPAVQFKSTGTRLTVQEYLDAVNVTPQEKAELKDMINAWFKKYEASAAAKGLPNDWALAYVSYVGLNSHIYNGVRGQPSIPFEQNVGLRDVVAENATDNGIFNNISDRQKQEQYEIFVMTSGLVYSLYEKALRENNSEDLKQAKVAAAQNLKIVGLKP